MNRFICYDLADFSEDAVYQRKYPGLYQKMGQEMRHLNKNISFGPASMMLRNINRSSEKLIIEEISKTTPQIRELSQSAINKLNISLRIPSQRNHYILNFRTDFISHIDKIELIVGDVTFNTLDQEMIRVMQVLYNINDPHVIPFYVSTQIPLKCVCHQYTDFNIFLKKDHQIENMTLQYDEYFIPQVIISDFLSYEFPTISIYNNGINRYGETHNISGIINHIIVSSDYPLKRHIEISGNIQNLANTQSFYQIIPLYKKLNNNIYIYKLANIGEIEELDQTLNSIRIYDLKIIPQTEVILTRPIIFNIYTIGYNMIRSANGIMCKLFDF
jgi:hypothetical protein